MKGIRQLLLNQTSRHCFQSLRRRDPAVAGILAAAPPREVPRLPRCRRACSNRSLLDVSGSAALHEVEGLWPMFLCALHCGPERRKARCGRALAPSDAGCRCSEHGIEETMKISRCRHTLKPCATRYRLLLSQCERVSAMRDAASRKTRCIFCRC